jgi:Rne/Rng family ribonuclease
MNDPAMVRVTQYHTGGASLTKREMNQRGAVQTEIWFPSDERAVVVEDGVVVEMLDNTGNKQGGDESVCVGDVYLGVVVNKVPNMKSLMVSCSAPQANKSKAKMVLLRDGLADPAALWKARDKQGDGVHRSVTRDESYDELDGNTSASGIQNIRSMRERLSRASKGAYGMYGYGDAVILEIIRDATEFKGPVATAEPSITGRFTVLKGTADGISAHTSKKLSVLNRDELADLGETLLRQYMTPYTDDRCTFVGGGAHLIMRTAALNAPTEAVRDEVETLTKKWKSIIRRAKRSVSKAHKADKMVTPRLLWRDSQDFKALVLRELCSMNISSIVVPDQKMLTEMNESIALMRAGDEDMRTTVRLGANQMMKKILDSCFSERVPIRKTSSAELVIQSTEALTAIDVNMGSSRISVAEVNIAAARTAAAEIRRRNLSGIIVIDFINVNTSREQIYRQVEAAFADAASRDRAKISFAPISPFGLMEITRERLALGPSTASKSQVSMNTPRAGRQRPPSVERRTR